jgi:hypothetical protein
VLTALSLDASHVTTGTILLVETVTPVSQVFVKAPSIQEILPTASVPPDIMVVSFTDPDMPQDVTIVPSECTHRLETESLVTQFHARTSDIPVMLDIAPALMGTMEVSSIMVIPCLDATSALLGSTSMQPTAISLVKRSTATAPSIPVHLGSVSALKVITVIYTIAAG